MEQYLQRVLISLLILSGFHIFEYLIHKYLHPKKTNINNLLLSRDYLILQTSCFAVALLQWFIIRSFLNTIVSRTTQIGMFLIIFGLVLRLIAIFQLKRNYAHYIYLHKNSYNKLVTNGIYSIMRHPCYNGFIIFQVGIQFYLQNIIGIIVFAVVLDIFFRKRVTYEERMLCRHFPGEYEEYKSRVCFGVL